MEKNLPYFLVIAALFFLIIAVLSSGERPAQTVTLAQNELQGEQAAPEITLAKITPETTMKVAMEKVIFDFEEKVPLWEIPDWCFEKDDYIAESLGISSASANEGNSSLEVVANFPGQRWTAAYIEAQEYFDWTPYQRLSAELFLPADAPFGLTAKIILTVGKDWQWTEMSRTVKLIPGEWTTVSANIVPGSNDWRRTEVTDAFRADVRKLGLRIESNMRPVYSGPVYIDNIRLD